MRYYSRKSGKSLMETENLIKELETYRRGETPYAGFVATRIYTAEELLKMLCKGIQKYEEANGHSPSKIVISTEAYNVAWEYLGGVINSVSETTIWGVKVEVQDLPSDQVAIIYN